MELTLIEKIQFEYYEIKFLITDKQDPRMERLIMKKYDFKNKQY